MSTRSDFWIGKGPEMIWLGSVSREGAYWLENPLCDLMTASSEADFCAAVRTIFVPMYCPEQGDDWPWPWPDSCLTDYAYVFVDDHVEVYHFGRGPIDPWAEREPQATFFRQMK